MTIETLGTATYSPDDNKLRLYPDARLDAETYARVKAAGFKWAPKQDCFVAPMWTPEREDLLTELAGEIDDEDRSLVDRAEDRAERFAGYSERRNQEAEGARKGVEAITEHIPFGQPILVGHHSERRARRDAEKIERGMQRAVKLWETSNYWSYRAEAALRHAKYKELPNVRARRIKKIEADVRKMERAKAENESCLRFWRGEMTVTKPATGEKRKLPITEEERGTILYIMGRSSRLGYLPVIHRDDGMSWTAYDVLKPDGERYSRCPACTLEQCKEAALTHYPRLIARCDRWLDHYNNRLTYERAMLAEQGGTLTDRKGPEVGGAVRCWAAPGFGRGWAYIKKVNKVSVSIHRTGDHAINGKLRAWSQIMAFDKLAAIMTAAEVEQARQEGRLIETECGCGFFLSPKPSPTPDPKEEQPKPEEKAAEPAQAELFGAMKETLRNGGVQVVSAPQLFPTPEPLARRVVEAAKIQPGMRVLEPSAGTGNLVTQIINAFCGADCGKVVTVEINAQLVRLLETQRERTLYAHEGNFDVICGDFLQQNGNLGTFHRVVMNPPFADGQDIEHVRHAYKFLRPGGRLVAVMCEGPFFRQDRKSTEFREWLHEVGADHVQLPGDSFKDSGTSVNTRLVTIDKEGAES